MNQASRSVIVTSHVAAHNDSVTNRNIKQSVVQRELPIDHKGWLIVSGFVPHPNPVLLWPPHPEARSSPLKFRMSHLFYLKRNRHRSSHFSLESNDFAFNGRDSSDESSFFGAFWE